MEEVFVYETEHAIIRIHPGKRTPEERRAKLEESAKRFYQAIQREKAEKDDEKNAT